MDTHLDAQSIDTHITGNNYSSINTEEIEKVVNPDNISQRSFRSRGSQKSGSRISNMSRLEKSLNQDFKINLEPIQTMRNSISKI